MGRGVTGAVGEHAERCALEYLRREGLRPIDRNFRCRGGELDLVMLHGHCLVFVEVRYRQSKRFSDPALTVDARKQRKLVRTAAVFLSRNARYARLATRFDVIALTGAGQPRIRWIRDAFRPEGSML